MPLYHVSLQLEDTVYKQESGLSPDTEFITTLILDLSRFQDSEIHMSVAYKLPKFIVFCTVILMKTAGNWISHINSICFKFLILESDNIVFSPMC